jgi:sugar phosphate isomerase/epimerase
MPPLNIAGGYEGFLQILKGIESDRLGFLFDTGHAWAAMEDVAAIPTRVGGKIFGTHLCDNFGGESLKLMPGKGNINWKEVINNLKSSKYAGYYDLEIICSQEKVEEEYLTGLEYISSLGIL